MYHEKPLKIVKVAVNLNLDRRKVLLEVFSRKRGKLPHNKHSLLLHFAWTFHILFPHTFLFLFRAADSIC